MVFLDHYYDRVDLNEETLWSGFPKDTNNYNTYIILGLHEIKNSEESFPSIKQGYEYKKLFRLTRVAATISKILEIPAPADSEGSALNSIIRND